MGQLSLIDDLHNAIIIRMQANRAGRLTVNLHAIDRSNLP